MDTIKENNLFLDEVTLKSGQAKATGKPYRFYQLIFTRGDGSQLKIAANNPAWEGRVNTGGHNIEYTEKQNGKFTNRYLVEGVIMSEKRPEATKQAQTAEDFRTELREFMGEINSRLQAIEAKLEGKNPF